MARVQHRMVFDLRSDDVHAFIAPGIRRAFQGEVCALAAAAREDDLVRTA